MNDAKSGSPKFSKVFYSIHLETRHKTKPLEVVFAVSYGLVFLLIGFLVYWKKPGDRRAIVFFWMSTVAAIFFSLEPTATSQFLHMDLCVGGAVSNGILRAAELRKKIIEAVTEFSRSDFQDAVTMVLVGVE